MTLIIQKPTVIPPSLMVLFRSTLLTWPMHAWFWPPLITWNYLTGKKGKSVQITKPILRVEVDKQRKLNPGTLKLWDKVWHKCGISVQETSPESGYDQSHSWSSSGSCWRIIEGCGWSSANKAKKKAEAVHILCEELHRGGEVGPEHQRGALHGQIFWPPPFFMLTLTLTERFSMKILKHGMTFSLPCTIAAPRRSYCRWSSWSCPQHNPLWLQTQTIMMVSMRRNCNFFH